MADDFNLDSVMKESDCRNGSAVEDLSGKDELKKEDFSNSNVKVRNCNFRDNSICGRLRAKAKEYYEAKYHLEQHQANLWLITDFKAEGCTNAEMRKAFVTHESKEELEAYYRAKLDYDGVQREYELEVISLKKKEVFVL